MNKEDYVSLEVAKLLKEKGFDYATLYYYEKNGKLGMMNLDAQSQMRKHGYMNDIYPRPTLYEAAKWLRIKHGIYVTIISSPITWLYKDNEGSYITHFPVITYRDAEGKTKMSYRQGMNDSEYEKAFNLAILEALKLI